MYIVGIDAGAKGGIALLSDRGVPVEAVPMINNPRELIDFLVYRSYDNPLNIWVEQAGSRPTDSHKSAWGNGFNYGKLITCLDLFCDTNYSAYKEVHPRTWKSAFKLDSDKLKSKALCEVLWNDDKVRQMYMTKRGAFLDGVAEAMLIGYYGWLQESRKLKFKR